MAKQEFERRKEIDISQQSRHELRTALHIAVQMSNVGITNFLLRHGARDEWIDCFGMYAKDYIKDEDVKKLFIWRNMLENPTAPTSQPIQSILTGKHEGAATGP